MSPDITLFLVREWDLGTRLGKLIWERDSVNWSGNETRQAVGWQRVM